MQPWPIASTTFRESERLILHKASVDEGQGLPGLVIEGRGDRFVVAAGTGAVRLWIVQTVGKTPLAAKDFLLGHRVEGTRLGGPWEEAS